MIDAELTQIDFWDVGQADCTVLHFSDNSIILIDVGRKGCPVVDWLADHPREIRAIILTHNDADHAGALCSIIAAHSAQIRGIYMLADRPKNDEKFQKLFRCALEGERLNHYAIKWASDGTHLWASPVGSARLRVVHPSFSEWALASSPNATSAMVVLENGDRWLGVWPGDLSLNTVAGKCEGRKAWMLMGPHHGGPEGYKRKPESAQWVTAISPTRGFISVGTKNDYSHPRPRYVQLLGRSGCHVVCSQLTRACDPERARSRIPVFQGSGALGLRPSRSGTACRGAWRVRFQNGELIPDEFGTEHLKRIGTLRRPLCLRGRGWKKGEPLPAESF